MPFGWQIQVPFPNILTIKRKSCSRTADSLVAHQFGQNLAKILNICYCFSSGMHSWKNQNKYLKFDTSKFMSYQGHKLKNNLILVEVSWQVGCRKAAEGKVVVGEEAQFWLVALGTKSGPNEFEAEK